MRHVGTSGQWKKSAWKRGGREASDSKEGHEDLARFSERLNNRGTEIDARLGD